MYSDAGDTTSLVPGFPIRTSSDPRSVGSSPRHIAASHVLHRLSVPRHPPCALKHLQHKTKKMSHHPHTTPTPKKGRHHARVSEKFALQQKHTTHNCAFSMLATTIHKSNTTPHHQSRGNNKTPTPESLTSGSEGRHTNPQRGPGRGLVVSKPNSVSDDPRHRYFPTGTLSLLSCTRP